MSKSTVRNRFPRLAVRWAVALAVMAAVVAPPLSVGSPVSAQNSDDGDEIWSATMTVGMYPVGPGYRHANIGTGAIGSLSDDTVPLDRVNTLVTGLFDSVIGGGTLIFALDDSLSSLEEQTFTLDVGGRTFDFIDATYASDSTFGEIYSWPLSPRSGWASGATVALKITEKKSISIVGGPDVEYGGNNNAAESTARFTFSRTGNTDEALHFGVRHIESGEFAMRKFAAGQASFDNAHWAVDTDESNNPVCTITWQIVNPVPGYVIVPQGAVVSVSGPGTTCMSGI